MMTGMNIKKDQAMVAFWEAVGKIGVAYIVGAVLVGADTLIPHKYVIYQDGKKYVTNRKPS